MLFRCIQCTYCGTVRNLRNSCNFLRNIPHEEKTMWFNCWFFYHLNRYRFCIFFWHFTGDHNTVWPISGNVPQKIGEILWMLQGAFCSFLISISTNLRNAWKNLKNQLCVASHFLIFFIHFVSQRYSLVWLKTLNLFFLSAGGFAKWWKGRDFINNLTVLICRWYARDPYEILM